MSKTQHTPGSETAAELDKLKEINAELLEALYEIAEYNGTDKVARVLAAKARAAIVKAKANG